MRLFNRPPKSDQSVATRIPAIEALETRSLLSAALTVTVPGPIPGNVVAGQTVNDSIAVNIANNGDATAKGPFSITLFASTDQVLSTDDAQIVTVNKTLTIGVGKNKTVKVKVHAFPTNLNADYFIVAQVSGTGVNDTGIGANGVSTTTTHIGHEEIDLADSFIKVRPNGKAGKKIPVVLEIANDGNVKAKGPVVIDFGASATPNGANAFPLGSVSKNINIKNGKFIKLTLSVPLPIGIATGNQYLTATVDPTNTFNDPNLANNTTVSASAVSVT